MPGMCPSPCTSHMRHQTPHTARHRKPSWLPLGVNYELSIQEVQGSMSTVMGQSHPRAIPLDSSATSPHAHKKAACLSVDQTKENPPIHWHKSAA